MIAALRYNNPGDVSLPITGWTGPGRIVGIPGQPGYAEFPDMATGYDAFLTRLRDFLTVQGLRTIAAIGPVYATDPHWPAAVSILSGIGLHELLDPASTIQMQALAAGIVKQETGQTILALERQSAPIDFSTAAPAPVPAAPTPEPTMPPTSTTTSTGSTSLFGDLITWGENLIPTVLNIATKGNTELTAFEAALKAGAPTLASAVDQLLTVAETVTAVLDPAAEQAIATLKTLFDGLIKLVEQGAGAAA